MRVHQHRVRSYEVDSQGFVFNGRFLEYADAAMTEYFRALGWGYNELVQSGADPSVVQLNVTYRQPAKLDDELTFDVDCTRVGTSSFDLLIGVDRETSRLVDIVMTYVNVDTSADQSRPLPAPVAQALRSRVAD